MEEKLKIEDGTTSGRAWRLFVAISLPESVKDEIEKTQRELRNALPGNFVRWTKREQFHLTLKFLGNVMESRAGALIEALRDACLDFTTLRLRAEGIGFFPDLRRPRVVWAGVRDENNMLSRVQQAIEAAVKNFTAEKSEDKFTGHVTLGRIQRTTRLEAEILTKMAHELSARFFGEWMADAVELIRSELSSGGSRYTTIATIPLSGKV